MTKEDTQKFLAPCGDGSVKAPASNSEIRETPLQGFALTDFLKVVSPFMLVKEFPDGEK